MSTLWILLALGIAIGHASPVWDETEVEEAEVKSPDELVAPVVGMQEEVPLPDIMKEWRDRNMHKQYEEHLARDIQDLRQIEQFLKTHDAVRENVESSAAGGGQEQQKQQEQEQEQQELHEQEKQEQEEQEQEQGHQDSSEKQSLVQQQLEKQDKKSSDTAVFGPFAASVEVSAANAQVHQMGAESDASNAASPMIIGIVAVCSVMAVSGMLVAAVCVYRLKKRVTETSDVEYPAYGVTGPTKERVESPGDRKLAQSAQMYHYQHQKQQMIMMERANPEMKQDGSDYDSDDDGEEGDYTVYECPGLAPTGEMEVQNPLFNEESAVHTGSSSDASAEDEHK